METIVEVLKHFIQVDGKVPHIGDSDDGYVLTLLHSPQWTLFQAICNTGAVLFKRGDFKHMGGNSLDEKALWVTGTSALKTYEDISAFAPETSSTLLPQAGYFILRDSRVQGFMDVGPLGYTSIAAHGHADALSLVLNCDNAPIFVDPGTYAYHTQKEWREYFRGTAAHNTWQVDELNQSVSGGNFMWLAKAQTTVDSCETHPEYDYLCASHNGYQKQKVNIRHQRELVFLKGLGLIVVDTLENLEQNPHRFKLHWHLHPNCDVQLDNGAACIRNQTAEVTMSVYSTEIFEQSLYSGSLSPIAGWYSESYNRKEPTGTLQYQIKSSRTFQFVTCISLAPTTTARDLLVKIKELQSHNFLPQFKLPAFMEHNV